MIFTLMGQQRTKLSRILTVVAIAALLSAAIGYGVSVFASGNTNKDSKRSIRLSGPATNQSLVDQVRSDNDTMDIPGLAWPEADKNLEVLAAGSGSFWALSTVLQNKHDCAADQVVQINRGTGCLFHSVDRISPASGKVIAKVPIGGWDLAYGDGAVWVASGKAFGYDYYLYEISPATDRLVRTVTIPSTSMLYATGAVGAIAVGGGDVYFMHEGDGNGPSIDQVSVTSGALLATWSLGAIKSLSYQITVTDGLVWVGTGLSLEALNEVTGAVVDSVTLSRPFQPTGLVVVDSDLWVAGLSGTKGTLVEIDPTTGVVVRELSDGTRAVTTNGHSLWAAEIYDVADNASLSSNWTPKSMSEYYGELSFAQINTTTGQALRRIDEPNFGGTYPWIAFATVGNHLGTINEGPSLLLTKV